MRACSNNVSVWFNSAQSDTKNPLGWGHIPQQQKRIKALIQDDSWRQIRDITMELPVSKPVGHTVAHTATLHTSHLRKECLPQYDCNGLLHSTSGPKMTPSDHYLSGYPRQSFSEN